MIWPGIIQRDVLGIRFAINVFIGSTITWYTLSRFADTNPIWAIASMIAASDPEVVEAARMFRCRIINVFGWLCGRASGSGYRRIERMEAAACLGRDRPRVVLRDPHPNDVASGAHYGGHRYRRGADAPFQA